MVKFFSIFFLITMILVFIYFFKENSSKNVVSYEKYHYINESDSIESKRKYQEKLNNVVIEKERQISYSSEVEELDNFEKLNDYLEKLKNEESKINLNNINDVADHSLKYKILLEKIKKKYGSMEMDNPYRSCVIMVSLAGELWTLDYSKKGVSENYYNYSRKYFLDSYFDAKENCFNVVNNDK
ncbi:hypothetical protein ACMUMS_06225 [Acinetobacter courvalinii]|uniref:hypothetical protein n=1 Tax=Acinetobacter courvalinii TaxID=280147 RepID=UPI003A850BEC